MWRCESKAIDPNKGCEEREGAMRTSTKVGVIGGASLLGVVLAFGAGSAAAGSLTTRDAPGQVLQVSGVEQAAGSASPTVQAPARATVKAPARATVKGPSVATAKSSTAGTCCVALVPQPAPQTLPTHHAEVPQSGSGHHVTTQSGSGHDMVP